MVGCAGKQVQRHVDPLQVHASPPDLQRSAEEEVVAEQVAHDPQIELAGDVLGVLEPVLELGVTRDMRGIADAVQQGELALHLGARLDQDEAGEHVLALQHTAAGRDQRFVEAQVTTGSEMAKHLVDHRLAGVEVDRCPRDRERVHALGRERGVEGGEPAALAVPDQVHASAAVLDRAVDDVEVIVDRGVGRGGSRPEPVERECPLQPGCDDRSHLALLGGVVDDARVVSRLRRQHERRHQTTRAASGEITQARERSLEHNLVRRRPGGPLMGGHQLEPAL